MSTDDIGAALAEALGDDLVSPELHKVCGLSDYVRDSIGRKGDQFRKWILAGHLDAPRSGSDYRDAVNELLAGDPTVADLGRALREFRRREMVRIIYRDFLGVSRLEETTADLSHLADACIDGALGFHYRRNLERYGEPRSRAGQPQQMCVLALGKLGAGELNLSSDVDLVFLYDEQGMTTGPRELSCQEFFIRTARGLIASLDETTADGFVFRVDMRLRPFGESSPLIHHWAAMETYFLEQGRDWERYAYIKARPVAGDLDLGKRFLDFLRPFVYRRHLDFGAVESLREMKRLINRQVELNDLHHDLKLGPGGIREIEFIVQAHQLIYGGNHRNLQVRPLVTALELLGEESFLPPGDVQVLHDAYRFLRDSEHAIQGQKDRQTQLLPADEVGRARLASVMGYGDHEQYLAGLERHRGAVRECFARLMESSAREQEMLLEGDLFWPRVWRDPDSEESVAMLERSGFADIRTVSECLNRLAASIDQHDLQEVAQDRLHRVMPVLLSVISRQADPDGTLARVLPIVGAIERRSTYVAYLLENPDALKRTVELCAMSPWVAEQLNEHPILLYELTDAKTSEFSFTDADLTAQLDDLLMALDPTDDEVQMDTLRVFKSGAILRVAVCELLGLLPIMKASDALTVIAEIVLQRSIDLAWRYLEQKHGSPSKDAERKFVTIAYGKLGGIELAYGSDLDLVFLYGGDSQAETSGPRPISNSVFFSRLAQRIIHILSSFTRFGKLYEADMRLRPSGNQGPIVTTMTAFERYQREQAWTWEHQALIRARFVAGDPGLGARFEDIRRSILRQPRTREDVLHDVVTMREKMRENTTDGMREQAVLLSGFDLKHEIGAIVDIEFMVQYAVLAWAEQHSDLTRWTDNMRLLEEICALELLDTEAVELLQKAYLAYRSAIHYQWLGGEMASFDVLNQYRQAVHSLWQRQMLDKAT